MAVANVVQANHALSRMATHICNPLRLVPQLLVFQSTKLRYGDSLHKAGESCSCGLASSVLSVWAFLLVLIDSELGLEESYTSVFVGFGAAMVRSYS